MNMIKTKSFFLAILILFVSGCTISPGMYLNTSTDFRTKEQYVYIESLDKKVPVKDISEKMETLSSIQNVYRIGNGDQISITVWGLPEIFPISNINPDQNLRRVDSNGNLYFPYAGLVRATGKTQNELREELRKKLSSYFTDPQLDVSIARFNSQKIYLLGEITQAKKINITDIPLSLSDALGEAKGLSTNSSNGAQVFIIRQSSDKKIPIILKADLSSPASFISAGNFYLEDNDIIYVNANGTTRWNRVISQFFPFSTFLNSIDNLTSD